MIAAAAAAVRAPARTITLADLRRSVGVSSPQISPDGGRIAVYLARQDFEKDRLVRDLVLIDVHSRAARTLLHDARDVSNVEWSPDGSRIAYIARGSAGGEAEPQPQIFVMPMNGGEPMQITHGKTGVNAFDWRPDGKAIAYASDAEPANKKAIDAHQDEFEITQEPWTAQAAPAQALLYEIRTSGGRARRIGSGAWSVGGGFTYSADGRTLFVTRVRGQAAPTQYLAREIVRIGVASGAQAPLARLSSTQADPLRSADGHIAFSFANPRGTMQSEMAIAGTDGSRPHSVTAHLDRDVGGAAFLPGNALVLYANDRTQRRLFRVAPDGSVSALPLGPLNANFGDQSASRNGTIAFTANAPNHPSELFVLAPGARLPVRLTDYNRWIRQYRLGRNVAIAWRTADGLEADGVVTEPPGFTPGGARRYPLVLYIHGGPTSASSVAYSGFPQVLAAHGWFVFQPNYRGSDNLGLRYARTTVPHITSVPGRDIEDGLAALMRRYPIDASRIGVSGWSEGGLLTSWLITQDRRWRAAVSGAAVNDWVQYGDMTDAKDFTPQFIGASPWTDSSQMKLYEAESPLTYAGNVRTPTLIMSDSGDYRVPTPLAYEFYHEIRATGTPVQFVVYPVVAHFPNDPVRSEDIYRRWETWLAKYL